MARPKTHRTPEETEEYLKSRRQRMTETQRRFRERMKAVNPPKEKKRRKRKPKCFTPEEEEERLKAKRKRRAVNQRRYCQKIKMRKQNDDLNAQLGVNLENEDPEADPPKQLKIKDLTPEEREEYFKSRRRRMTETQRRYRERIKKKKLNGEPTPQRVRRKVKPSGARVEKPWAKTIMSLPWVNTEEEEQERIRLKRQKMTEYQRRRRERIRNEKQKGDPNYEGTKKNSQRITREMASAQKSGSPIRNRADLVAATDRCKIARNAINKKPKKSDPPKICFIDKCYNTSKNSEKLFVTVPLDLTLRKLWYKAAGRPLFFKTSRAFCCEDHFDLNKDSENVMQLKMMGPGHMGLRVHKDVVPHKCLSPSRPKKQTKSNTPSSISKNPENTKEDAELEEKMSKDTTQNRMQSRRAASKEALKHMQHIFNDERQDSSSDDDVVEVDPQPPPKKKLKLSNPKPTDGSVTLEKTLVLSKAKSVDQDVILLETSNSTTRNFESVFDLDFEIEELSESQKKRRDLMNREDQEVGSKLEEIMRLPHSEIIYNGVCTTALEINEQLANVMSAVQHAIPNQGLVLQAPGVSTGTTLPQSYQLVMDARSGVIVGAVTTPNAATSAPPLLYQTKVVPTTAANAANLTPEQSAQKGRRTTTVLRQVPASAVPQIKNMASQAQSKLTALSKQTPPPLVPTKQPQIQVKTNLGKQVASKFAKAYSPALKKIQASNLLPKTAPLLKPTENSVEGGLTTGRKTTKSVVDLTSDEGRPAPDSREISFNKLQGRTYPSLVVVARPHLRVKDLSSDRVALDAKVKGVLMFPPTKFTEWLIQQGLVRSDQKCSVHTANPLKLGMYSDATKFPYSGGYVWISECCPQRFVSVFSGSLFEGSPHPPMTILKLIYHWSCQTIVQNVTQWVKVDNLYVKGMYTCLRGICTVALHTHLPGLGGPGVRVQVGVISLGTTSQDGNQRQVKVEVLGIMETATKHIRLRAVEPLPDGERNYKKRFQKILEPVFNWVHPQSIIVTDLTVDKPTLHNMGFLHVSQNTSTDYSNSNRTIMEYLRRIVPRMFQNTLSLLSRQIIQQFLDELVWREWYGTTVASCFNTMLQHVSEQTRVVGGQPLIAKLTKVGANPFRNWSISVPNPPKVVEITQAPKRYQRVANKKVVPVPVVAPPPPPPPELAIVRPAKSTSPDVPKQLVPLENYYYGTMNVFTGQSFKMVLNIKCSICRMTFSNNIHLMNHLFRHAHNVSTDVQLCRYCLTIVPTADDLQKHVASSHPEETKSQNDFVCLICETHFMNPFVLGKHMSKEHCPSELPYMCGTCSFRCSNHKQAVDHFYQQHDNGSTIQCPFCLKSTAVNSGGRNIIQNLNYFIQHLQKHQKKQMAKKCGRCNLWFIQKEILKDHQLKMHMSQRGKHGLYRCLAPRNGVMVPKSQSDKSPNDAIVIDFSTLNFNINKKLLCKECEQPLASSKHFTAFQSCQNPNCLYSTCCSAAMEEHVTNCKNLKTKIPLEKLPFEMFCVCGYRVVFGNLMAKHLAICERKSAYPSGHAAKAATSTHSMLDVLGLVRRPEENPREKAAPKSRMATRLENDDDDAVVKEENELPPLKEEEIGENKSPSSEVEKGSEVTPVEKEQLSDEKESETATDEKKSDDPLSEKETESLSTEKKNDESSTEEENDESAQAIEKKDEEPLEESLAEKEGESEAQSNKEKNIIEESRPETEEVEPMDVSGPSKEKSSSETETPMDVVDAEEEKSDGAV